MGKRRAPGASSARLRISSPPAIRAQTSRSTQLVILTQGNNHRLGQASSHTSSANEIVELPEPSADDNGDHNGNDPAGQVDVHSLATATGSSSGNHQVPEIAKKPPVCCSDVPVFTFASPLSFI
jgi:hypothetical protein